MRTTTHGRDRGFGLVLILVCMTALFGMLGVSVDLGRMFIVKNELQAYADTAALAAALELDGSTTGVDRARSAANTGPVSDVSRNRWNFGTRVPEPARIEASFATSPNGPFLTNPSPALDYRFVQVAISEPLPMYFLSAVPGISIQQTIAAVAVGGQSATSTIAEGVDPFSPDAVDPSDPDNFGFQKGGALLYTLKWAPFPQRTSAGGACNGDLGNPHRNTSAERGYLDLGQDNGNSGLNDTVVNKDFYLNGPLGLGSQVSFIPAYRNVAPALNTRIYQDSDPSSSTYTEYVTQAHNGRRIVTVPVNNNGAIVGFASFFLPANMDCLTNPLGPCCAEYIGPAVLNGKQAGAASTAGLYSVKLFR